MQGIELMRANLGALRRQVLRSIEDLTDDEINRTPDGLQNTIGIVLRHLVGSERFYVYKTIGGNPFERNRDAEFGHDRLAKANLVAAMQAAGDETERVLAEVSPAALAEEFELDGRRHTKEWALLHTVEHYAYHHGQIRVYRRLVKG